jgi:hypothetical protein
MAGTPASAAEFRPVPLAVPLAGAGFGLVLLAVVIVDSAWGVQLALLAALAVAAIAASRDLRRAGRGHVLAWDGRGRWTLDGQPVAVAPSTRVHPGLVVLVLRQVPTRSREIAAARDGARPPSAHGGRRRSVHWVPRFACSRDAFRRLKSQLRHGPPEPAAERPGNTPC